MNIEIELIKVSEKSTFLNVYQFYIYEMSCFYYKQLSKSGLFDFDVSQFNKYWTEAQHWPYFIFIEGFIAGFCLLRKYPEDETRYDIEQYFVLSRYKRKGVGASVLHFSLINTQENGKYVFSRATASLSVFGRQAS